MAEETSTFIDADLGDAVELQAQPEDEYNITCTTAEVRENENGRYVFLRCVIPDVMESKPITHVIMHPADAEDDKDENMRLLNLRRACEAFGVDWRGGFDVKDFKNKEARAYLTVRDSDEWGRQNDISRFVSGPSESEENRSEDVALA